MEAYVWIGTMCGPPLMLISGPNRDMLLGAANRLVACKLWFDDGWFARRLRGKWYYQEM